MANISEYQLVAIAGTRKGGRWAITRTPLVLGRSAGVDVMLYDPLVSRRHCSIRAEGEGVLYEDLGARNLALVNRMPCRTKELKVGDELSLGKEVFIVTHAGSQDLMMALEPCMETTSLTTSTEMRAATEIPGQHELPRTVNELADLYAFSLRLSTCVTKAGLVDTGMEWLSIKLAHTAMWAAGLVGLDDLVITEERNTAGLEPPMDLLRRAVETRRGYVSTRQTSRPNVCASILAAPILFGGGVIGAVALKAPPERIYGADDLRYLGFICQAIAPFIRAVAHMENLRQDNARLRSQAGESVCLVGESHAMKQLRAEVTRAAPTGMSVLITGETGTGKELVARLIHEQSPLKAGPFIAVNCAAIPRELFESTLFGHVKGAFTGADCTTLGMFELSHNGTLFLDEIGDLSLENQARILRAIELGTFRKVGGEKEIHVDVRIVSATNKEIPDLAASGLFRADLYHRLNTFEIQAPPLRSRPTDITVLVEHFLAMFGLQAKRPLRGVSPDAIAQMRNYPWPGNVRELRSAVRRAIATGKHEILEYADFGLPVLNAPGKDEEILTLEKVERQHIERTLRHFNGNVAPTAAALGIGRSTLYRKLTDYGIEAGGQDA